MRNLVIGAAIATLIALLFSAAPQAALGQAQTRQPTADGGSGIQPQRLWREYFTISTAAQVHQVTVPVGAKGVVITDWFSTGPVRFLMPDHPPSGLNPNLSNTGFSKVGTHGMVLFAGGTARISRRASDATGSLLGYTF